MFKRDHVAPWSTFARKADVVSFAAAAQRK